MKERPIIFGAESVRAILDGRKTQTRRAGGMRGADRVYWHRGETHRWGEKPPQPYEGWVAEVDGLGILLPLRCPYGQPGDRLWVRETWAPYDEDPKEDAIIYRADPMFDSCKPGDIAWPWKSPIHMPRWASRITLEVTGIRVERLQEISYADVIAEGNPREAPGASPEDHDWYRTTWDSLNAKRGYVWEKNPWVWVIGFRTVAGENLQPLATQIKNAALSGSGVEG